MATDHEDGKRHVWGPRPVASLVPNLVRPAFRRKSPAGAQILIDWPAIVGPALAAVTTPRRLSAATLTIACAGPVALELQHMSSELLGRINGYLGRIAVERLRLVQDFAAPAVPRQASPASEPPLPLTPAIAQGALHDALARLGYAIRAERTAPVPRS